jgi:hypothetical protein
VLPRRVRWARFGTGWLTSEANLAALTDLSGAWIDRVDAFKPQPTIVVDMDGGVSKAHCAQESTAYNGHFACICYEPWTLHDVRLSYATNQQRLGVRPEVIEPLLNYVSGSRAGIVGLHNRHAYWAEMVAATRIYDKWLQRAIIGTRMPCLGETMHQALHHLGRPRGPRALS